jgi:hypothetical protein
VEVVVVPSASVELAVVAGVDTEGAANAVSVCGLVERIWVFTSAATEPAQSTPATDTAIASFVFIVRTTRRTTAPGWVFRSEEHFNSRRSSKRVPFGHVLATPFQ